MSHFGLRARLSGDVPGHGHLGHPPPIREEGPLRGLPPLAKFALGKVPLISVFGFIFCGYLGFLLYEWLIDPQGLYGISYRNGVSVSFMLVLCILAAALFFGMRMHRRRAGMAVRAMCPSGGIHGPPVS